MPILNLEECRHYSRGSEKPVNYACDICGALKTRQWNLHRSSYIRTNRDPLTGAIHCKPCAMKVSGKTKKHTPAYSICGGGPKKGTNSPSWKGGTFIGSDGYKLVYVGPVQDQKSKWESYRKEHFIVAEEKIGRPLLKGEVVHHIDGDKLNNSPDNLQVLPSEKAHGAIHTQLDDLAYSLIKAGLIQFDGKAYVAVDKLRELLEHPESL